MENEKIMKKVNELLNILKDLTEEEKEAVLQISQILIEINDV
jgi:hypothetical protein|nr:MAG TPA: hypothetical protein [Caudoviricetes sp.]